MQVLFADLYTPYIPIPEGRGFTALFGKRSVKQKCIDPETKELLPGCFLVKKGEVQPARAPERFGQKVRRMTQKSFLREVKADVADLMTEMCRYADIDKEFVLADFIREDTLYLKQVSR